jgi:hypothetical protein
MAEISGGVSLAGSMIPVHRPSDRRIPAQAATPCSGLVVAGALAGPGGQLLGGGEDAHGGADLGHDHPGGAPLNAGGRAQQLNGRRERGNLLLDGVREPIDLLVEEVDVGEDRPDPERMKIVEATLEGLVKAIGLAGALLDLSLNPSISRRGMNEIAHVMRDSGHPEGSPCGCGPESRLTRRFRPPHPRSTTDSG